MHAVSSVYYVVNCRHNSTVHIQFRCIIPANKTRIPALDPLFEAKENTKQTFGTALGFFSSRLSLTYQFYSSSKLCFNSSVKLLLPPFYSPFWDHPGEVVPEENFWTFWCKGRLTEADTDHPAGCHSIWTNQCSPPPSPMAFCRPHALPAAQPTVSKH